MPRRTPLRRAALVTVLVTLALALATLTVVQSSTTPASAAAVDPFTVRPGTTQLEVLDATTLEGDQLELLRDGTVVDTGVVDSQGSLMWRQIRPGSYTVRTTSPATAFESTPAQVTAFSAAAPDQSFYSGQTLHAGFNFIETRDGTTLSANVVLPNPAFFGAGPYPTVVEYSGYDPSNPRETAFPSVFTNLGYAYVGVNIRGTGCSGGSFLPFEPVQSLDGYDAIEAVAAQSWVKGKVGMVGISYPGIEQLYVARTTPPHLAAITPLSVIDDTYRGTLWPGGILNTGFATPWATDRAHQAAPYGEGWEHDPDPANPGANATCDANQLVRLQNPDPVALIEDNPFYNKTYYQQIDPSRFVHTINVPVYIAGAWQDEQTGGHFPEFLNRFTHAPHVFATMSNGSHTESLSLGEFGRYSDFLDFYVAHRIPTGGKAFVGPRLVQSLTGMTNLHLTQQPSYAGLTFAQAKKKFNASGKVRILFEEGDSPDQASGAPAPRFVRTFRSWPIPQATTMRLFLGRHGRLSRSKESAVPRSFAADPSALPATDYHGSSSAIWRPHPAYDWKQIPKGTGIGWISAPLTSNLVSIGTGSVDVWVRSSTKDVDLEATLSDVRRNGREVYVQSGWLRASHRKLIESQSTATKPVHTDLEADARPMPKGTYRLLRIPILPFAQPFRVGDRIRITLDSPGGAKPLWAFDTLDHGQRVTIASDRRHPSSFAFSVVPHVAIPRSAPPCRSLRSQPCRTYGG
jgi:predicted acyl esterase